MTKLYVFGDSWVSGEELAPYEKTFGEILSVRLELDFVNCGVAATSLEHMILQLKTAIEENNLYEGDLCVFFLTSRSRSSYLQNKIWQELTAEDRHYVNLYSDELSIFRSNMVLLSLHKICHQFRLNDYYLPGWEKFESWLAGINLDKIYDQGRSHCLHFFKIYDNDPVDDANFIYHDYNHYIRPNICHPNQLGHEKIASHLYNWIKNDTAPPR